MRSFLIQNHLHENKATFIRSFLTTCLALAAFLAFGLWIGDSRKFPGYCDWSLGESHMMLTEYASKHGGKYPPPGFQYGVYSFDMAAFDDPYMPYAPACRSANHPNRFMPIDTDFFYFGYALPDEETALLFLDLLEKGQIDADGSPIFLAAAGDGEESRVILPLTQTTTQRAHGDPYSTVPVFIERPENHADKGYGYVLFLDGAARRVRFGEYPYTDAMRAALARLK